MKPLASIFLLTAIASIGVIGYFILSERESNSFENYQALLKSGLIERGWVPKFIPKSSYNIKEHHRVDNSSIHVEFYFKKNDVSYFIKACDQEGKGTYKCKNNGYPVKVTISNNHATIQSI